MNKTLLIPLLALTGLLATPLSLSHAWQGGGDKKKEERPVEAPKPVVYKLGSVVDEKLALRDLDGNELTFKDLRGKVVLLHFWSIDCPYEVVADPKFTELEKRWKDNKDVVILAVNANASEIGEAVPSGKPGYERVREHMKTKGLTHRVFADHGNKLADLFEAKSTPHCFVLDKKGTLVYAGGLDDDPKGEKGAAAQSYARDAVEATLAGKEIKVKESKSYGCSIKRVKR